MVGARRWRIALGLVHDRNSGVIADEGIRYLLIRADVLMGVAHQLPGVDPAVFLSALGASVFRHVQKSFSVYAGDGRFDGSNFLARTCEIAATLGWGSWMASQHPDGSCVIEVGDSPFAAGYGSSPQPVCTPIVGVLRALSVLIYGSELPVVETSCAAQGTGTCEFRIGG